MIRRPADMNAFEFVTLAGLRAAQLTRGCLPRVAGGHKLAITAQLEVAEGKVIAGARSENRNPDDGTEIGELTPINDPSHIPSI